MASSLLLAVLLAAADWDLIAQQSAGLQEVVPAAASLRAASAKAGASFTRLVAQANALAKKAKGALADIQQAGCGGDEAQTKDVEECTRPLSWSCESVPPSIDWAFLKDVKRTADEELALSLGDPVLAGPANLFGICCGDLGCVEGGVGVSQNVYQGEIVASFARLAKSASPLGKTALETLRKSAAALEAATCSCDEASKEDLASAAGNLEAAAKSADAKVAAPLRSMAASLRKGLPATRCKAGG